MKILGLSLGDTSTAAVMIGDQVAACASEERFSLTKRDESYPRKAIDYCLKAASIRSTELDAVVIGGVHWDFWRWLCHYHSRFSIEDLVREQEEYWHPSLYEGQSVPWATVFHDKWDCAQYPGTWGPLAKSLSPNLHLPPDDLKAANQFLDETIAAHLGIAQDKISRVARHVALEAYAYWSSPLRGKGTGVIVLDAGTEAAAASVAAPLRFGLMRLFSAPPSDFRLAQLIRDVTLMLGLPPRDHDPVVMGLASQAPQKHCRAAYRIFQRSLSVEGMDFKSTGAADNYFHFLEQLRGLADDAVAGGIQRFAEDMVAKWVDNVVKFTLLPRLAVTGSLSMNHRIIARIAELKSVEELVVSPAAGDGTLALGACFQLATVRFGVQPAPWSHCYLGPDVGDRDVDAALTVLRSSGSRYDVKPEASPEEIAGLLARGSVIGRCAGRAEFGSRGLGNRSILADPRNARIAPFLAAKIKRRDLHAHFSPTILAKHASRYLKNPKGLACPFMTLAFPVHPRAFVDLAAALDPADGSVRPQILEPKTNPGFAAILNAFAQATGVGALLNTSLNESGKPMASTAKDAARVFLSSSLDYLLLGRTLIGKRGAVLRRSAAR